MANNYCVIMCGGVGSRFWPFSRADRPKQFLDFLGTGRSLLQMTVDRIRPLVDPERIILVTNAAYVDLIREQLPEINPANILAEPARRNTAPCICWAACHIAATDPDATIVTLPADHLILREEEFRSRVAEGFDFVNTRGGLLTLGIVPRSPNTGYGYIQFGDAVSGHPGVRRVLAFTEKPNLELAKAFVESGEFYWNAGMFIWRAKDILDAFATHAPGIWNLFNEGEGLFGTPEETSFVEKIYPEAESISVDYAIMEKSDNVYVMAADIGWSDLGTWDALHKTAPRNRDGNVTVNSRVVTEDCHDCLFAVEGDRVVVAAGLDNFVVAMTDRALLICPLDREQEIRKAVNTVGAHYGPDYI